MNEKSAKERYEDLVAAYGCNTCFERGNNGCGYAYLGVYEFEWGGEHDYPVSCRPNGAVWKCLKRLYKEEIERIENRTAYFAEALKTALHFAPQGCAKECYGDIVRSAAAVAVSNADPWRVRK